MTSEYHKQHRPSQAGRKKEKKTKTGKAARRENPKAFAVFRGAKAAMAGQRTADKKESKFHVPLVNRTPDIDPPPLVVAIVGPPNSGKTTLIRSLVKRFSRQNLSKVSGPITVVSGKNRRITLLECPNDLGAMIDVAKIADLVVLLIDASFGFEMETFEFLSISASHGMPKLIGVMTHLDTFTSSETLKKTKHSLKHRWWSEIHAGVKLFSLSGLVGGHSHQESVSKLPLYYPRDVLNLSRLLAVAKPRPIIWKNTNSYMLVDRIEDLTSPDILREFPHSDRKVALYGWTRGCALRPPLDNSSQITAHIPGIGDISLNSITRLEDPCPTPEGLKASLKAPIKSDEKASRRPRTTLKDLEKRLYAPMADVAGILYDKDAVYLDIPNPSVRPEEDGEPTILDELKGTSFPSLDDRLSKSGVQLFSKKASNSKIVDYDSIENSDTYQYPIDDKSIDNEDSESSYSMENSSGTGELSDGDVCDYYKEEDEVGEEKEDDDNDLFTKFEDHNDELILNDEDNPDYLDAKWKDVLASRKHAVNAPSSLQALVYGGISSNPCSSAKTKSGDGIKRNKPLFSDSDDSGSESNDNDDFFKLNLTAGTPSNDQELIPERLNLITPPPTLDALKKSRFATGIMNDSNDEYGDFEDLEALQSDSEKDKQYETNESKSDTAGLLQKKDVIKKRFDMEYDSRSSDVSFGNKKLSEEDDMYSAAKREMAAQEVLNRTTFEGEHLEISDKIRGFLPGTYIRVVIEKAPAELIEYFDPTYPIIIGIDPMGATGGKFGMIHARIKKHRWHGTILKSDEPLIWSAGWRRFQSIPLFYTHDRGARVDSGSARRRMIKYTPRHAHCMVSFYGPLLPNNTGLIACRSVKSTCSGWRIALTGVSLESTVSTEGGDEETKSVLVKKLKLTGTPLKISKHTALIKDMFNSPLEVAKFEGAALRSVSGIRGCIKKAVHEGPSGTFRATFEDKLLMSDIVFLRAWTPVTPRIHYNPVTSLLLRNKAAWTGMRLNWEIRRALDAPKPASQRPASVYDTTTPNDDRMQYRRFNPLHIPKKLEESLPFASKPKMQPKTSAANKKKPFLQAVAVLRDEKERKVASLLQELGTLKRAKDDKRKITDQKKRLSSEDKKRKLEEKEPKSSNRFFQKSKSRPKSKSSR